MAGEASNIADSLRLRLLVLRCQTGDDAAFACLLQEFGPRTLGYLASLVGDDADDVQQELWLAVHRHVATLADPGAFRTWLFRAARHRAIDWLRRARRERELFDDAAATEEIAGQVPEEQPLELAAALLALERLPPMQREVMVLRHRDGLSYEEIALVVGCAVGTVRSRLHHGRSRLQRVMVEQSQREGERQ